MQKNVKDQETTCQIIQPGEEEKIEAETEAPCFKCNGSKVNNSGLPCRKCAGTGIVHSEEYASVI